MEGYLKRTLRTLCSRFCHAYNTIRSPDAPKSNQRKLWWQKRTSEIPIEVLSKDVVTGFEEAHINLSDIDFYSKNVTIKEDFKCELCVQYISI